MQHALQSFTTETGEQSIVKIDADHTVTVVITGTSGSDDVDLEFTLNNPDKSGAVRYKAATNVLAASGTYSKVFTGPITGVALDIDTNVSNDITMEVRTGQRGS